MTKDQRTKRISFLNQNITHGVVIVDFEMTENQRTKRISFLNQNITHGAAIVDFEMTKGLKNLFEH